MSFLDAFKNPLPSKRGVLESTDLGDDDNLPADPDNDNDDLDSFDDDVNMDLSEIPEVTEVTPEEEEDIEQIINLAATPIVLKDTLGLEAVREFVESSEFTTACDEGFFLEGQRDPLANSTQNFFLENGETFLESKFYQKNSVRLTKQSKLNQLFEICVQAVARAKNDAIYFKLTRVQELRRKYKSILRQRYKSQATRQARNYLIRLKQSKSPTLKSAADKMDKK